MGGRGIGGGVRENNGYCFRPFLLRMVTSFFLFIMVAFENLLYIPDLKMVLIFFLLRKCSKTANVQMSLCLTLAADSMSRNGQRQGYVVA